MVVDDVNEEWIESRKAARKKQQNSVKKQTSKESCSMCDIFAKNFVTNDRLLNYKDNAHRKGYKLLHTA
jgi:hypothetical protein